MISRLKRRIISGCIALVLIGAIVAANVVISTYSLIMHRFFAGDSATGTATSAAKSDELVRLAAEESMVLIKNDDLLPLKTVEKVNLFGYGSTDAGFLLVGGGSGGTSITEEKTEKVDLTDAFTEAGISYNTNLIKAYENYSTFDCDWRKGGSTGANSVESLLNPSADFYTAQLMDEAFAYSDVAVVTLSRWAAENGSSDELVNVFSGSRKYNDGTFLELTAEEKAMLSAINFKGFKTIVLLNTCNNIELSFFKDYPCIKACIYVGIPGQSGAAAIPKIIKGEVNPSGRLSDALPYDHQTFNPVYANAIVSDNNITYAEGIYFGYKWYETADAEGYFATVSNEYGEGYNGVVQYPFGHGLSYTTFDWQITSKPTELSTGENTVKVKVTNTGAEKGKDVVELYVHAPYASGGIEKAERILVGFAKTPVLYPAAEKDAEHPNECEVEIRFNGYDVASYDDYDKNGNGFKGYELEKGAYTVYAMRNSHDVQADLKFDLALAEDKTFATDPETGKAVENRFTGATAYASCPVDGGAEHLSRKNGFINFPTAKATLNAPNADAAASYVYDGYDNADVSSYKFGENGDMFLVKAVVGEGENKTTVRAKLRNLNGEDSSLPLVFDKEIMEYLSDYDSEKWDLFLNQLTKDEILALIGKGGFMTEALYSVGKPRCTDKDGPAGFNNNVTNPGKSSVYTVLPGEALLGCSFNVELCYELGKAQAQEGADYGVNGWYGPGVNLHRSVYNTRNYEYYSEDAVLSGKIAASIVNGAKDNDLYCYVKHFAVSEEGMNPRFVNTWLTEQALRETYLKPFEIAVKEGGTVAIMSSFNSVGAVLSGYNHALLTDVLRDEWGFKGSVITDWFMGTGYMESFKAGVIAGNDLWLAGTSGKSAGLDLNDNAQLFAARRSAKNILYTFISANASKSEIKVNAEAHSVLVDIIWIGANVLLGGGLVLCICFVIFPIDGKKKTSKVKTETKE